MLFISQIPPVGEIALAIGALITLSVLASLVSDYIFPYRKNTDVTILIAGYALAGICMTLSGGKVIAADRLNQGFTPGDWYTIHPIFMAVCCVGFLIFAALLVMTIIKSMMIATIMNAALLAFTFTLAVAMVFENSPSDELVFVINSSMIATCIILLVLIRALYKKWSSRRQCEPC